MSKIFEIDYSGYNEAIKNLEELEKKKDRQMQLVAEALAREGCRIASMYYSTAAYAGTNDVTVTWNPMSEKYQAEVVATGNAVMFIEFGTGITKKGAPEAEAELLSGFPLQHGAYGKMQGANPHGWWYKGKPTDNMPLDTTVAMRHKKDGTAYARTGYIHTYGNDAIPAMYLSRKEVCEHFMQIIDEVMKNG